MVQSTITPAPGGAVARPSRFERLAGWSYRRRWWALVAWVVVLAGVTIGAQAAGDDFHNDFSLPGTESQAALDTLKQDAPVQAGATVQIVMRDPGGLGGTATRERVEDMLARVKTLPHVAGVRSPYADQWMVARDGTIGYATVTLDGASQDVPVAAVTKIMDTARTAASGSLQVEFAGDPVMAAEPNPGGPAESIGLLAALIILMILFGSLLAATLPIVVAVFAVGSTISLIALASHVFTVAEYTSPLMILVGLGVGIDYALLLFSRYRGELLAGADRGAATRKALDTAGRTVFFAGCTVIIALVGLVVLGLGSLQGVAVAVALTVLVTMAAALTLLPALLAIMGGRIERSVRRRAARARRQDGAGWRRWTAAVQRRPWPTTIVAGIVLLALSAPVLGMNLGFADPGNGAPTRTSRQAYDLLAKGFGPGFNGPIIVVVKGDPGRAKAVQDAIGRTPGVADVTPPQPAESRAISTLITFSAYQPQDTRTADLVRRLREDVLPPVARQTGTTVLIGGGTAAAEDFAAAVTDRLPIFVIAVVGLSSLLLLLVFRSILIPIKAAVLNLLSVAAAMGVVTLVFQQGLLGGLLGIEPGPVEAFVPVLIFAIAFGLSMDYEVFLLSRMHEEWERRRDAGAAVREGMATTGRVVTAAAAIMVVVFAGFLLSPDRMLKQFGLGLAVAVFLDALVIRCLIVPAVMQLFGARAWWLPRGLARVMPRIALEKGDA
ncbi:membrane protein [Sphaerisporangium rufum]|uniref:Membrane protein n=1 Tax=Sphaerisporangium rufum TaxID=1381558 RepID=A0A919QWI4_9ACTN|nr:MMPL family transporter [Sphaerisporangium rufum]GII75394.1 membrane protein [Sphaerisporangium rufum]